MEKIEDKFIRYVKIDTESDEHSTTYPSTEKQWTLARLLYQELTDLGIQAEIDPYGLVYAKIDGDPSRPKIGLIAHMDTAPTIRGGNFEPRIVANYDGKDIPLNEEYTLSPSQFPHLHQAVGKTLIVTDGDHLLGGDDKAGVAIIMSIAEYFSAHPELSHAPIRICFTPDEEIGAGADHFDVKKMDADVAYTLDGGDADELNIENFNASAAKVSISGVSIHPGSAKGIMVNAALLAMEFNALLDPEKTPSRTEGYEGFHHLEAIKGDAENCTLSYILREHDEAKLRALETELHTAAETIRKKYPSCEIHVEIRQQYQNMKTYFDCDRRAVDIILRAFASMGISPRFIPIRGGTDGARITYMGLPCPNIGTGDRCCHGRYEHVIVEEMYTVFNLVRTLLTL